MASILSLPDDCLFSIVSCIDDPGSFYSIALTCRKFLQVTRNAKSVLHTNVLWAKAEYFMKCHISEIGYENPTLSYKNDKFCKLRDLLRDRTRFTAAKGITCDKVINVWQRNGPVAAELLTWLRYQESWADKQLTYGDHNAKCKSVILHLPSCGKRMVIESFTYYPVQRIHVTGGDLDVTSEVITRFSPEHYMSWKKEKVRGAVEGMDPVIQLLQKELGKTVPPITDHFFIWLCYFFPDKSDLLEEHKLSFQDPARNMKPTHASLQPAIDEFHKSQQTGTNFQNLASELETDIKQQSKYSEMMVETIGILAQRSETKVLERLQEDACRFYEITTSYDLTKWPKQLLLHLLLRTSLESSTYILGSIVNQSVESRVFFKCFGGKVIKVCGVMTYSSDESEGFNWDKLELVFTLPDGTVLNLEDEVYEETILEIENLSPLTQLLQEAISHSMQGEEHIPEIDNLFTATYFLYALEFWVFTDILAKLFVSESEEEWSADEGEPLLLELSQTTSMRSS